MKQRVLDQAPPTRESQEKNCAGTAWAKLFEASAEARMLQYHRSFEEVSREPPHIFKSVVIFWCDTLIDTRQKTDTCNAWTLNFSEHPWRMRRFLVAYGIMAS